MIKELQNYIESIYTNVKFGQIQDEPDENITMNLYEISNNQFFSNTDTKIIRVNVYVRETSYENLLTKVEHINLTFDDMYDIALNNIHIVHTNKVSSDEPFRDDKNRYSTYLTFDMTIINKEE